MARVILSFICYLVFVSCFQQSKEVVNADKAQAQKVEHDIQFSSEKTISEHCEEDAIEPKVYSNYETKLINEGYKDIASISDNIRVELAYTTSDNFVGEVLYDSISHAFLHPIAFEKLQVAHQLLQEQNPNYTFYIFDALRPNHAQHKMWKIVKGTAQQKYVASPYSGSIHNFGCAVDLSIFDLKANALLDMGTEIDYFGRAAEYRYNQQLVNDGSISSKAMENRIMLRKIMKEAGFLPINTEWWHFNALPNAKVKSELQMK